MEIKTSSYQKWKWVTRWNLRMREIRGGKKMKWALWTFQIRGLTYTIWWAWKFSFSLNLNIDLQLSLKKTRKGRRDWLIYITLNIDLRLYLKKDQRKSRVLIIIERVCNVSTSSSSLSLFSLYLIFLYFAFLESMNFVP